MSHKYLPLLVIEKCENKLKPIFKKEEIDCSKKLYYVINGGSYEGLLKEYTDPKSLVEYLNKDNKPLGNHGWCQPID